ncbi:MAG: oxidoreductase [Betaproteobacteria bacterium]|nr:oxidoreductase [Betaproteobacteria bacterium]
MDVKRVAIAGGTGLVGGHLLAQLCTLPAVKQVFAVGRRAPAQSNAKLKFIECALDSAPDLPAIDTAFCCLGTTIRKAGSQAAFRAVDLDMVVHFARAAKKAGATHFGLVSALGANAKSGVFYNRVKGEAEAALMALGFESLTLVRPSLLLGERDESRPAERFGIAVSRVLSPLMIGPARRVRPVDAEAVARTLLHSAQTHDQGIHVVESEQIT